MAKLKDVLLSKLLDYRREVKRVVSGYGDKVISEITVAQAYGGMRNVKCQICDTSTVDPDTGLTLRGIPLAELVDRCPEEMFWLLLTGELPDADSLSDLQADLAGRAEVPEYVFDVLRCLPKTTHPIAMQSIGLLALEEGSKLRRRYEEGMRKEQYWEACFEDSLDLIAKMPTLTAGLYRIRRGEGELIPRDPKQDWSTNFAHMLGVPDPTGNLAKLMRLYLAIQVDHEGGNISASLCHIAGSALSDPYYAVSAGLNGLAGPLQGLTGRDCLNYTMDIRDRFNGVPTSRELTDHVWKTLYSGRVIPGFGHPVLRSADPRYVACHEFGLKECPDHELFKIADMMYKIVPGVLKEHGRAKNVNPNVEALSGVLLHALGVTDSPCYTAIFGASRSVGMCAQMILNRAIGTPISRPKSVTSTWVREQVGAK